MMSAVSKVLLLSSVLLVLSTRPIEAGVLSTFDAGLLVESTAIDSDFALVSRSEGFSQYAGAADYDSTRLPPFETWSGVLSGAYLGKLISSNYSFLAGDYLTQGLVSWTSSGTLGSSVWSGSGSATFVEITSSLFTIDYSATLTLDGVSQSMAADFLGEIGLDGTIEIHGNIAGGGKMGTQIINVINGNPGLKRIRSHYVKDCVEICNQADVIYWIGGASVRERTWTCPETASFVMFGTLFSTWLFARRLRR